jgi:hypothetical protein
VPTTRVQITKNKIQIQSFAFLNNTLVATKSLLRVILTPAKESKSAEGKMTVGSESPIHLQHPQKGMKGDDS